ncbi:MAG: ABC transporter substrate-binding protein [Chloroflexi bacterium]|nr:ABC transporter substrate-binding protein [Chloroflexota bacterium]
MDVRPRTSRRAFLRLTGLAAASTALIAACAPAAPPTATPAPRPVEPAKPTVAPQPAAPTATTAAPKPAAAPTATSVPAKPTAAPTVQPVTKPQAAAKTSIQVWAWATPDWKASVDEFNATNAKIEAKLSAIGDTVWGDQKILTAVAAGTGPDVAVQGRHQLRQWAMRHTFRPVNDYIQRDKIDRKDYFPDQWDETTWAGKIYGLPLATDVRIFFWNKKLFAEVGLDPAKPPKNLRELEEYAVKLTKKSGSSVDRYGFLPYWGNTWTWLWGLLFGAEFLSPDNRTITCDDPKIVEAVEWMVGFYDRVNGGYNGTTAFLQGFQGPANNPFVLGKVAMVGITEGSSSLYATFPELDFGAAPVPWPDGGRKMQWSCAWSAIMPKTVKQPDAGWELIKYATSDGYLAMATKGLELRKADWERQKLPGQVAYFPPMVSNRNTLAQLDKKYGPELTPRLKPVWELAKDAMNWSRGCGIIMGPVGEIYWVTMDKGTQEALLKKKTAKEAMAEVKAKVQAELDTQWKKWEANPEDK